MTTHYTLLVRAVAAIFGCIGIWWGSVVLPDFLKFSSTKHIANRIAAGDPFKGNTFVRQRPILRDIETSAFCEPSAIRSAAIMRLRMADLVLSSGGHERADELQTLDSAIRNSLSCSPADPFLWLALFWMNSSDSHLRPDDLNYLRISYSTGPNEGWIGVKRNRLAFARYDQLTADLADNAVVEFGRLVESGFFQAAAEIFGGLAAKERYLVLAHLNHIPKRSREDFLKVLNNLGYDAG